MSELNPTFCPYLTLEKHLLVTYPLCSNKYYVIEDGKEVGLIHVELKCVRANWGTQVLNVPYDIEIKVLEGNQEELPLALFKKVILATVQMS